MPLQPPPHFLPQVLRRQIAQPDGSLESLQRMVPSRPRAGGDPVPPQLPGEQANEGVPRRPAWTGVSSCTNTGPAAGTRRAWGRRSERLALPGLACGAPHSLLGCPQPGGPFGVAGGRVQTWSSIAGQPGMVLAQFAPLALLNRFGTFCLFAAVPGTGWGCARRCCACILHPGPHRGWLRGGRGSGALHAAGSLRGVGSGPPMDLARGARPAARAP